MAAVIAFPVPELPEYLSAEAIANMRLPGIASAPSRVRDQAQRHGWAAIDREGRGGGKLYDVKCLPEQARIELLRRARIGASAANRASNDDRPLKPIRGRGRPTGTNFFARNPLIADAVEALLATTKVSAPVVLQILAANYGPDECPSLAQLHRFIRAFEAEKKMTLEAIRDPEGFKSRRRLALGSAGLDAPFAHHTWEIDTTKADVMTTDAGRVCVLGIVDVYSRRLRFKVVPSESGQSVRRFLAETMTAWGAVPHIVATDQGSGFINASVKSALEAMAIEHKDCPPASPEQKPFIERSFGTATRARLRLLKGFLGHNVAEAAKLRARARKETGRPVVIADITAAELQAILENWADGRYANARHSTTGQAPLARMLLCNAPKRQVPDAETLRIAMSAFIGTAKIGKRGVQWRGGRYWTDALIPHHDRNVTLRRDEDELGELFVFDDQGRFIGTAVNHHRAGVSEAEFATAARQAQARWFAASKAELKAKAKRVGVDQMISNLLIEDGVLAGKVAQLPIRTDAPAHSTPAIDSLRQSKAQAPAADPDWNKVAADQARRAAAAPTPINRDDQVRDADALIAAAARGEAVDPQRLSWARGFTQSSTYRTAKAMAAAFARARPKESA